MAEGSEGTCPQVFVVDSQANYVSVPRRRNPRWARAGQKFLFLLVGFATLGLVVEGFLIYNLYKKMEFFGFHEAFSLSGSHHICQNQSNSKPSVQQGGTLMSHVGTKESNEIPTVQPRPEQVQQRPFAQLIGSSNPVGQNNVVQWEDKGDSITHNMSYKNGRLLVEKDGYYYLFSKVTLNAAEECSLNQHKVMRETKAYGVPIELMKSKSFRCWPSKSPKDSAGEDLFNSFLAGIFQLQKGDEIFVTLDNIKKMLPGTTDNLMGAFMIHP